MSAVVRLGSQQLPACTVQIEPRTFSFLPHVIGVVPISHKMISKYKISMYTTSTELYRSSGLWAQSINPQIRKPYTNNGFKSVDSPRRIHVLHIYGFRICGSIFPDFRILEIQNPEFKSGNRKQKFGNP